MSLAHHLVQPEGFDYEGPANPKYEGPTHPDISPGFGTPNILDPDGIEYESFPDRSSWRRLSFAPIEIVQKLPNLAAYKVSEIKRYGELIHANLHLCSLLTVCSSSSDWHNSLLARSWHRLRFRRSEAHLDFRRHLF
jgi:hypothetical protein